MHIKTLLACLLWNGTFAAIIRDDEEIIRAEPTRDAAQLTKAELQHHPDKEQACACCNEFILKESKPEANDRASFTTGMIDREKELAKKCRYELCNDASGKWCWNFQGQQGDLCTKDQKAGTCFKLNHAPDFSGNMPGQPGNAIDSPTGNIPGNNPSTPDSSPPADTKSALSSLISNIIDNKLGLKDLPPIPSSSSSPVSSFKGSMAGNMLGSLTQTFSNPPSTPISSSSSDPNSFIRSIGAHIMISSQQTPKNSPSSPSGSSSSGSSLIGSTGSNVVDSAPQTPNSSPSTPSSTSSSGSSLIR